MHPRLFDLDVFGRQLTLSSYGLCVASGVMLGIYLGYRRARRVGLDTDAFLDLNFWGLIVALLGSRLLYVLTNLERFRGDPWRVFAIWEGGLVFYGGVAAACATGLYFFWRRGLPFLQTGDIIAPSLSLGHAFGRVGCYLSGCCWGKTCASSPPGVRFGPDSLVYDNLLNSGALGPHPPLTTPLLHPVQLYEAVGELAIFTLLVTLAPRKRYDGVVFCTYLAAYAVLRGVTELYRGDAERRFLFEWTLPGLSRALGLPPGEPLLFSTSQFVALLTFGAGVAGLMWIWRRARPSADWPTSAGPGPASHSLPSPPPASSGDDAS